MVPLCVVQLSFFLFPVKGCVSSVFFCTILSDAADQYHRLPHIQMRTAYPRIFIATCVASIWQQLEQLQPEFDSKMSGFKMDSSTIEPSHLFYLF